MFKRERRRFKRIILEKKHSVVINSIGSQISYSLKTRNISIDGLFLECENPERVPFTPSSLIEAHLDIDEGEFVFFNIKIVHFVLPQDNKATLWGPGFGVKIVQISKEDKIRLESFVQLHAEAMEGQNSDSGAVNYKVSNL